MLFCPSRDTKMCLLIPATRAEWTARWNTGWGSLHNSSNQLRTQLKRGPKSWLCNVCHVICLSQLTSSLKPRNQKLNMQLTKLNRPFLPKSCLIPRFPDHQMHILTKKTDNILSACALWQIIGNTWENITILQMLFLLFPCKDVWTWPYKVTPPVSWLILDCNAFFGEEFF